MLKLLRNEQGVSLVTVIITGAFLSLMGYVTVSTVVMDTRTSASYLQATQAFWLAESGIERTYRWLRFQNPPPGGSEPFTHYDNASAGGGAYTVIVDPDDANPSTYLKKYRIISVGRVADVERTIEIETEATTFNRYAYLTGDEGGTIWFNTGDLIEGPLHSNDRISIVGNPVFMGKVSSSSNSFNQGNPYNPVFQQGFHLGVPPVNFPTPQEVLDNYVAVNASGPTLTIDARFGRRSRVEFNQDGTLTYNVWHYNWWGQLIPDIVDEVVNIADVNGMVYVDGDVRVSGIVNGNVTVIATDDIIITDDIVYEASDSQGKPLDNCDDMLGLVSHRDIIVANNSNNRDDVVINGALLALGDSFTVQNYNSGSPRGDLTIWGSLSQRVRGPVGTFGSFGTTGYRKDYHYDSRFLNSAPPYFPATGQYHFNYWKEVTN